MNVVCSLYVYTFDRSRLCSDRYVILGNHRDAWCLGAVDPTGGTAVMMEISRVFGMLKQEGKSIDHNHSMDYN